MSLSTEVFPQAFERDAAAFAVASGRTSGEVLRTVGKSAARDLVKLTPPTRGFNPKESFAQQRRAGLDALEGELSDAYVELDQLSILERPRNLPLSEALREGIRRGDHEEVRALLAVTGVASVPANKLVAKVDLRHHQRLRNRRGKIPAQRRRYPFYVMQGSSVRRVRRERARNIGVAKAGWARAALTLGVALPVWIRRHSRQGRVVDLSRRLNNPAITLSNTVSYVAALDRDARFVHYAVRNAHKGMLRQLDAKMKGLWGRRR